jgi:hypothetical protein
MRYPPPAAGEDEGKGRGDSEVKLTSSGKVPILKRMEFLIAFMDSGGMIDE